MKANILKQTLKNTHTHYRGHFVLKINVPLLFLTVCGVYLKYEVFIIKRSEVIKMSD